MGAVGGVLLGLLLIAILGSSYWWIVILLLVAVVIFSLVLGAKADKDIAEQEYESEEEEYCRELSQIYGKHIPEKNLDCEKSERNLHYENAILYTVIIVVCIALIIIIAIKRG